MATTGLMPSIHSQYCGVDVIDFKPPSLEVGPDCARVQLLQHVPQGSILSFLVACPMNLGLVQSVPTIVQTRSSQ